MKDSERAVPVLYLDIGRHSPQRQRRARPVRQRPRRCRSFPRSRQADARWKRGGGRIAAVSNQGGVGERNPKVLAQLARKTLRRKLSLLEEAFTGYFTDHHAFLLTQMLGRVDAITVDIAALDARIEEMIAPFAEAVARLDEIPGIALVAASAILAEIGLDMTRFPTSGHLVSWAKYAPGVNESAGKKKGKNSTGHGNPYLARVLGNAAASAAKTDTFLGDRYRRIARRRGARKANVAIVI